MQPSIGVIHNTGLLKAEWTRVSSKSKTKQILSVKGFTNESLNSAHGVSEFSFLGGISGAGTTESLLLQQVVFKGGVTSSSGLYLSLFAPE